MCAQKYPLATMTNSVSLIIQRQQMVCKRCKVIMYPGPTGSSQNHKRGFCSDGCPVSFDRFKKIKIESTNLQSNEVSPPFPQPEGIFTIGESFNPFCFLKVLRALFDRVVTHNDDFMASEASAEDPAFSHMLQSRTTPLPDGVTGFRLYRGLRLDAMAAEIAELVVEHEGARFLRLPMLGQQSECAVATTSDNV